MATRYVTLKDSNGDTIYPQAVVANISDFTGATASTDGDRGLVPAPAAGDQGKMLTGAGTWGNIFETVQKTVTLDATGNADLNILASDYWVVGIREYGAAPFKNAHLTPYTWSDGHYFVHGDMNYGQSYATGSINIEILMVKKGLAGS